jgi:hypothetical protein
MARQVILMSMKEENYYEFYYINFNFYNKINIKSNLYINSFIYIFIN